MNLHVYTSEFLQHQSFHQIKESSNIFAAETLHKNCNISRRCALDARFLRWTTNCSRYVDISASELKCFNQHSKVNIEFDVDFGVSKSISRCTEYLEKSATRASGKDKNPIQRAFKEVASDSQRTKQIDRVVIINNKRSSSAPLQYRAFQHQYVQGMIFKSSLEGLLSLSK